jgi:hypothetical protein
MNDGVRPQPPVLGGPQPVLIPSGSFKQGMVFCQARQHELALFGNHVSMQMLGKHLGIRAPLMHWRRILSNAEPQHARLVPNFDRLDKEACGELAIADCARTRSCNAGPFGISQPSAKVPLLRLRQFRKITTCFQTVSSGAAISIALRTSNTGGGALASQITLAGDTSNNVATVGVASLKDPTRYTNQPPKAPSGRASGKAMAMQISPSNPTSKNKESAAITVKAPNPTARAAVAGRKTQDVSPPRSTGYRAKMVNPYRPRWSSAN